MTTTCLLHEHDGVPIRATIHPTTAPDSRGTILSIHGGGLIFGSRDDLPQPYIDLLTASGYHLVALDYLLAPESKFPEILDVLHATIMAVVGPDRCDLCIDVGKYILMGRSAGAFLALQITARLVEEGRDLPDALLAFYGYPSLDDPAMQRPNRFYNAVARVEDTAYDAAIGDGKRAEAPLATRYNAYVYHRQRGTWAEAVLGDLPPSATAIPDEILAQFPPAFLVHAIYDPDVPYGGSKRLARKIPGAELVTIYEGEVHDVDRDPAIGLPLYRQALAWLNDALDTP